MGNPLITVIVPVYKAEAYLEKCVNSIRNQTYKNLEIILVDDGSPDNCGVMCDQYASEDSRIKVFHKENGGQSSARNLGLDNMTGDYVGFVDSDDWIEPNMYERLYELMCISGAQISVCGLQCDYLNSQVVYTNKYYPKCKDIEVFSKIDALKELTKAEKITNSPCDKLFSRFIFNNIRMRVGTIFEDFEIMPQCVEKADVVAYDPTPLYHYVMTKESTIRGTFQARHFIEGDVSRGIVEFYKDRYPQILDYALAKHLQICLNIIAASMVSNEFDSARNILIDEIKDIKFLRIIKYLDSKYKIKYLLFRININLYAFCVNKYYKAKKHLK